MPIQKNINHKHAAYCDYCGNFHGYVDDEYLHYSGYANNTPKFKIVCIKCWELQYGILSGEIVLSSELVENKKDTEIMEQTVKNRKSISGEDLNSKINWNEIDQLIKDGQFKINNFAKQILANPTELKTLVQNHYGDRIEFRRGRTGGVYFTNKTQS